MKELFIQRSTNGRWGISVVGDDDMKIRRGAPFQATIVPVGIVAGLKTYRVSPTTLPQWVLIAGDAEALGGASVIINEGLQSSGYVTILALSRQMVS